MGSIVGSTIGVNHWDEDTRRMRWGHFGATLRVGLGVPCGVLGPLMGSIVGSAIGVNHWGHPEDEMGPFWGVYVGFLGLLDGIWGGHPIGGQWRGSI